MKRGPRVHVLDLLGCLYKPRLPFMGIFIILCYEFCKVKFPESQPAGPLGSIYLNRGCYRAYSTGCFSTATVSGLIRQNLIPTLWNLFVSSQIPSHTTGGVASCLLPSTTGVFSHSGVCPARSLSSSCLLRLGLSPRAPAHPPPWLVILRLFFFKSLLNFLTMLLLV